MGHWGRGFAGNGGCRTGRYEPHLLLHPSQLTAHANTTARSSPGGPLLPLPLPLLPPLLQVGDGNINFVFIVEGPAGALCIKQALPYVRCVGESWPLTQVGTVGGHRVGGSRKAGAKFYTGRRLAGLLLVTLSNALADTTVFPSLAHSHAGPCAHRDGGAGGGGGGVPRARARRVPVRQVRAGRGRGRRRRGGGGGGGGGEEGEEEGEEGRRPVVMCVCGGVLCARAQHLGTKCRGIVARHHPPPPTTHHLRPFLSSSLPPSRPGPCA